MRTPSIALRSPVHASRCHAFDNAPARSSQLGTPCPNCGAAAVRWVARAGRVTSYRNLGQLPVPDNIAFPMCIGCRAEWVEPFGNLAGKQALDDAYRRELHLRFCEVLSRLSVHCSQRALERLLDISQGYFSHVRAKDHHTSTTLLSLLALIAADPKTRLAELQHYWKSARHGRDLNEELQNGASREGRRGEKRRSSEAMRGSCERQVPSAQNRAMHRR